ncbi:ubiquitinyl hydrolase 1 [Trifolium repens]|nr:ubiquitinyl hydrolase 1 [Trifolium repens]
MARNKFDLGKHRPSSILFKDCDQSDLGKKLVTVICSKIWCILEDRGGCRWWDDCPRRIQLQELKSFNHIHYMVLTIYSTSKPSEILARLNKMVRYDPDEEIGLYEVKAFHI